jgi:hypothetical protein
MQDGSMPLASYESGAMHRLPDISAADVPSPRRGHANIRAARADEQRFSKAMDAVRRELQAADTNRRCSGSGK